MEIKAVFCDFDDTFIHASPFIQAAVEENTIYKSYKLKILEQCSENSKYVYKKNRKKIEKAIKKGKNPELIAKIKIGSNDVIKDTSVASDDNDEMALELWCFKRAMEKAQHDLDMFLEERDHFLELDNLKKEGFIVGYEHIKIENLIPGSHQMVMELTESGQYGNVYFLTHQTGPREDGLKKEFINKITEGKVGYLSLRYHSGEYKEGVRRPRSSKAKYAMEQLGLESLEGCVLIDDSLENLDEWEKYGGIAILYRPMSSKEKKKGKLKPHDRNYPRITEMVKKVFDEALKFYEKKEKKGSDNKRKVLKNKYYE